MKGITGADALENSNSTVYRVLNAPLSPADILSRDLLTYHLERSSTNSSTARTATGTRYSSIPVEIVFITSCKRAVIQVSKMCSGFVTSEFFQLKTAAYI